MEHIHMDHGMDHDMPDMDHGGHGGMDMDGQCAMNMIWNTQIIDTCIVFPQWHIRSTTAFVISFFVIVALGIFYEWLRAFARRLDRSIARSLSSSGKGKGRVSRSRSPSPVSVARAEEESLLTGTLFKGHTLTSVPPLARTMRAALYALTVFLSFFLMLVFMTYNAYLILAIVLGAGIGHYYLGGTMDVDAVLNGSGEDKGMACH